MIVTFFTAIVTLNDHQMNGCKLNLGISNLGLFLFIHFILLISTDAVYYSISV